MKLFQNYGDEYVQESRPFTGAWIETHMPSPGAVRDACRPFTGAWIETRISARCDLISLVAPSRGRGLKLFKHHTSEWEIQGRPFTGAWIETWDKHKAVEGMGGRPFTGAWIETTTPR